MSRLRCDAAVLGGGFFGCAVAGYLKERMSSVVLIEQEDRLLQRASYNNQARIHNGYHYPRSLYTAYRSRVNFALFVRDFAECVVNDFTMLYCIGRANSKVTARQFERFCNLIGAPWTPARAEYARLFDPRLIEAVYEVTEYAFDSKILCELMRSRLDRAGVEVRLSTRVQGLEIQNGEPRVFLCGGDEIEAGYLFNCTYAGIRHVPGFAPHCRTLFKQELTEMALIEPPEELRHIGVTVMCGPFFSTMPFPPRALHTLSHVRYTPHCSWQEGAGDSPDPYTVLANYPKTSRSRHMLQDAQRYLPVLRSARIVDSLFEVKTLLTRNEIDDGRPILMERSDVSPRVYSVMGGKLDNIYDVIQRLQEDGL